MPRQPRRTALTPRASRVNRIPAYQLRRQRLNAGAVHPRTDAGRLDTGTREWRPADAQLPTSTTTAELNYADYRDSVEAAAARSRAELSGASAPAPRSEAAVPGVPLALATAAPAEFDAPPPGRAARAGRRPPNGRARPRKRQRTPDPRPRLKRPKTWFLLAAMLPLLAAIVAGAYAARLAWTSYHAYNKIHADLPSGPVYTRNDQGTPVVIPTEQAQQLLPDWDKKDPFNILLMGIDPRPSDTDPPRSDTIIVVHVDPGTKKVTMMSIPRDLLVTIPGHGEDKINAAYPIGEAEQAGGGPKLLEQTIGANFGIIIHYYATVDFDGFRKIVDTIGGIVVDVPAPVKDDLYPTENLGVTRVYFESGLQKMNGDQALEYARTRHGDNDIARGDRQQQILLAIRDQAMSLGLITQANELINEIGDSLRTDLSFNQMLALANLGHSIDPSQITKLNLYDQGVITEHDSQSPDDPFYWQADWNAISGLMSQYFNSQPVATGDGAAASPEASPTSGATADFSAAIVVENASNVDLLATNAVQRLRDANFNSATPDTATTPVAQTVIYDSTDNPATAEYVARVLGIPASDIQHNANTDGADIVVILGADAPVNSIMQGTDSSP